jgi:hypothetical protein
MPNRTQIVCLHEGERGRSIDPVFIMKVLRDLNPSWIRSWDGSNVVRAVSCGGRKQLIDRMPTELRACLTIGSDTTLMVWADIDDMPDGNALREEFWQVAQKAGIQRADFDKVVFAFARNRLENWVEFLSKGKTDEDREGPRVTPKEAANAAGKLANMCKGNAALTLPPSLQWSCKNWRTLIERMKESVRR